MDDYATDDEILIPKVEEGTWEGTTSSKAEQEQEEEERQSSEDEKSDAESEKDDRRVLSTTTGGDLHSRHPWFKKWLEDGKNVVDLLPEQYPTGYDPPRNESKWLAEMRQKSR